MSVVSFIRCAITAKTKKISIDLTANAINGDKSNSINVKMRLTNKISVTVNIDALL